jgi:hypothetical protein
MGWGSHNLACRINRYQRKAMFGSHSYRSIIAFFLKLGKRLANAVTGEVGTGTNMSAYPTNQKLTRF